MNISQNISQIMQIIKNYPKAKLLVVTKNRSANEISKVIKSGVNLIGENRIQETEDKFANLNLKNVEKHLIGHLQKNKVKKAIKLFNVIQSVDSMELAKKIDNESKKIGKIMPIYLQINISKDIHKSGFETDDVINMSKKLVQLKNLKILGLMTIPKYETDAKKTRLHFRNLKLLFKKLEQQQIFGSEFKEISMGMSRDFKIALEEGATLVRVGTRIFS